MRTETRGETRTLPPNSPAEKGDVNGRQCRVAFSYAPQHEDELALKEGDILTVLEEVEEGWWKGILAGKVGMFPSNFVEEIEPVVAGGDTLSSSIYSLEPTNNAEVNGNPHPLTDIKSEKVDVNGGILSSSNSAFRPVHHGSKDNVSAKDDRDGTNRRKSSGTSSSGPQPSTKSSKMATNTAEKEKQKMDAAISELDKIAAANAADKNVRKLSKSPPGAVGHPSKTGVLPSPPQPSPPILPPKPVRELARVMFPYTAEHEDELDLREGEVLSVLSKDLEDKGWWKGELAGRVGVFPDNFVRIISSGEETTKPPRPEKPAYPKLSPPDSPQNVPQVNSTPAPVNTSKDKTPPPLPGKNVVPPPIPTEKKPGSQTGEETSPNKTFSRHAPVVGEDGSLSIGRETHLTHLARPKGPSNRRLPSQILKDKKKSVGDEDDFTSEENTSEETSPQDSVTSPVSSSPLIVIPNGGTSISTDPTGDSPPTSEDSKPPWLKELRQNQKKKRLSGLFTPTDREGSPPPPLPQSAPPQPPNKPAPPTTTKPAPLPGTKPQPKAPTTTTTTAPVPQNRGFAAVKAKFTGAQVPPPKPAEGEESPPGSPTRPGASAIDKPNSNGVPATLEEKVDALYKELIPKVKSLEQRLEEQQAQHARQIQLLTKDLDEERKLRACLEIEVDRLNKLIVTTYAQV